MKIHLAKSAGFCLGVKRAIEIAFKTSKLKQKVYMLGDIVHNEEVVKEIKNRGIKKLKKLGKGKDKTLLIRAHGSSKTMLQEARARGYQIVDATCPMVKEIHKIVKLMEKQGYQIVIIGDKKHDEVQGINGQLTNKAIVIEDSRKLPLKKLKKYKKACVVVQSTQNMDKVLGIVNSLKPYFKELRFFNTICQPTRSKQTEIKTMPLENELMIIIGSRTSANTRRLYEISKSINQRTYWVESKSQLEPQWFKGIDKVGVSAGASTPDRTTQEVIKRIKVLAG